MAVDTRDCELLDALLDELDIKARQQHVGERSSEYWVCQRRFPRHPFRTVCKVRFLNPGSFTIAELPGRTRNLSRNGLGLIVRRVFELGDPIEVEVQPPNRAPVYMAGLIRFCRYAGRGYHEIGLQVKVASPEPVISRQPSVSPELIQWLRGREDLDQRAESA